MNILSLFDGMSCGQQALNRCGFTITNYFASEIDKHAIKVTQHNYPNTIQLGSVVNVNGYELPKIDLLIGGSPCQSFSFAGKRKGMSTKDEQEILTLEHYLQLKSEGFEFEGQSYLFWEYMRLLNELRTKNPNIYFLLENVEMGEKWELVLSRAIGVKGIHINSALVSAQNRKRIYWTNIGMKPSGLFGDLESIIEQPKDKGILLKDILESEVDEKYFLSEKALIRCTKKNNNTLNKEKSGCLLAAYNRMGGREEQLIVHNIMPRSSTTNKGGTGPLSRNDGKTYCLDTGNTNAVEIIQSNNRRLNETIKKHINNLEEGTLLDSYNKEIHKDKSITISCRVSDSNSTHIFKKKIIKYIVPEIVNKRKFEVDIESLKKCLKSHKKITNEEIANKLNVPKSNVEHWFRNDLFFSIPDKDIWFDLKELLEIKTDEFDESIVSFEQREGVFEKSNRIYDTDGISPKLTNTSSDEKIVVNQRIRKLTPIECERLQTVSDNYTSCVSDSQRYKMLGNGWTIDVICHILNYFKNE